MQILYRRLSYEIVGCCFEVYNTLGPFCREIVYQRALEIELRCNGIGFERKRPVEVKYQGGSLGKLVYRRIPFGANESHE